MKVRSHISKRVVILLLLMFILCSSACSKLENKPKLLENVKTSQENAANEDADPYGYTVPKYPWDRDENYKWKSFTEAETMQEAMDHVIYFLDHADVEYEYILRDYYYSMKTGERLPALWLYAVNENGEWLDVVMMEESAQTCREHVYMIDEKPFAPIGIQFYRINENMSFQYRSGSPLGGTNMSSFGEYEIKNNRYWVAVGGHPFAWNDLDSRYEYMLDDGTRMRGRKEGPLPNVERTEPEYKTYTPAESLNAELDAIKDRLKATGLGYEWEMMEDTITVEGKEYPVTWMYATNELQEWVDVILTEDTELIYHLDVNRDILWDLRKEQRDTYNALHPGRANSSRPFGVGGQTGEWLLQDVFYNGYSFILAGHGLAMRDCGSCMQVTEWHEDLQGFGYYYDRDKIWEINVFPDW